VVNDGMTDPDLPQSKTKGITRRRDWYIIQIMDLNIHATTSADCLSWVRNVGFNPASDDILDNKRLLIRFLSSEAFIISYGVPGGIRTPDRRIRSPNYCVMHNAVTS
jgi:hypothetical protein